jgi:hypothetical protein
MNALQARLSPLGVHFLCVYIEEAHADDEWPIRTAPSLRITQPTSLHARATSARRLVAPVSEQESSMPEAKRDNTCGFGLAWPVALDNMRNQFNGLYAAWPVRAFVVDKNGGLRHILQPRPLDSGEAYYYDFRDLETAVQVLLTEKHTEKLVDA